MIDLRDPSRGLEVLCSAIRLRFRRKRLGNPGYPDLVGKFDEKIRETPVVEHLEAMTIITVSQVRFTEIR
jgi:hypothetical protein